MPDFIALTCPSCGAKLSIPRDIDRFACSNCGKEHIVERSGGIVALSPVVDTVNRGGTGFDKTAEELAIVQLRKEIEELKAERDKIALTLHRPKINILGIALIVLGAVIGLVSISLYSKGSDGSYLAVIGFFVLFLGLFSLSSSRN
jgi:hypothetical protein